MKLLATLFLAMLATAQPPRDPCSVVGDLIVEGGSVKAILCDGPPAYQRILDPLPACVYPPLAIDPPGTGAVRTVIYNPPPACGILIE